MNINFTTYNMFIYMYLVILSFALDKWTIKCKQPSIYTHTNNFIHHMISTYIWFGIFLFDAPLLHLIICIFTFFGWFMFDGCLFTLSFNQHCGIPYNTSHNDLWNRFIWKLFPTYQGNIYGIVLVLYIVYDIYKIIK
jgi:hypothetical protein